MALDTQFRCDVAGTEALAVLRSASLPLRVKPGPFHHGFHRDIYLDTPDDALSARQMACRLRLGVDDRRTLTLLIGTGGADSAPQRFEAPVEALDPRSALTGDSDPARRLRGLIDPAMLKPRLELETERWTRTGGIGWLRRRDLFLFIYDDCTVRAGGLAQSFQELSVRRIAPGGPPLQEVARAVESEHGLRPIPMPTHQRAAILLRAVEGEALARALGSGRSVALVVQDEDDVAFIPEGNTLQLPLARGSGEEACRFLLRDTFGSGVGDLTLLGVTPASSERPAVEVWSARRIRTDAQDDEVHRLVWLPLADVLGRVGQPELRTPETLAALAVVARTLTGATGTLPIAHVTKTWPTPTPSSPSEGNHRGTKPGAPPSGRRASGGYPSDHFLNVELSQLSFNTRVLELAEDPAVPLLERLRFLAILDANLNEFFAVRVGALKDRLQAGLTDPSFDGLTPQQQLDAIASRMPSLNVRAQRCLDDCMYGLRVRDVAVKRWGELDQETRDRMRSHFQSDLLPILTPRALTPSPGHPFPVIPNLSLAFALLLRDDRTGPFHFAYLRLPDRLQRFVALPAPGEYVRLEEIVGANLGLLYPDRPVVQAWLFRVTRSADLDVEEEEAGDFLQAIEEEVQRRPLNPPVRVEIERGTPPLLRQLLLRELRFERRGIRTPLSDADVHEVAGMIDLRPLRELARLAKEQVLTRGGAAGSLEYKPFQPRVPPEVVGAESIATRMARGDILLNHPYDAFSATTLKLLSESAEDPAVTTIKMTLYRTGDESPVVDALMRAARAGKDVTVFVELKARFDEERNIEWVRRMEDAGVQVIYGVVGLKNHAKVALVVRSDAKGVRQVAHIGTGNYNAATARLYSDFGLLTTDADVTADLTDLFNQLTGSARSPEGEFRRLLVAPATLLPGMLERIDREAGHAGAGRPGRIRAQLNGLEDPEVIEALYRASTAGVTIDLLVRGLCVLRPGVPELSERIRVRSVLGRFLEHGRMIHFANDGQDEYFIGSADWRPRNLRRRIEVVVPIRDPGQQARLDEVFTALFDEPTAWTLDASGAYHRGSAPRGADHVHDRLALTEAIRPSAAASTVAPDPA